MTDREWRKNGEQQGADEREGAIERERRDNLCVSHVFLRLIITQIRPCFLLIRSAVSLQGVNMHEQTDTLSLQRSDTYSTHTYTRVCACV